MSADFLARGYSTFVAYLAEPAARSFLIGCAAAAALTAFRVKRVGARLLVWTAVLCAALAMPFLGAFLPRVSVKVPTIPLVTNLQANLQAKMNRATAREPQRQTSAFVPVLHDAVPVVHDAAIASGASHALFASAPKTEFASRNSIKKFDRKATHRDSARFVAFAPSVAPRLASSNSTSISLSVGSEASSPSSRPISRSASRGSAIPWTTLLLTIYLFGAAILLARLLVGTFFSRRLERAAQTVDPANNQNREALRLLRFRSCIAGLANSPRLKESTLLAVPATLGIHRAAILLPADWRGWSEEQLDAVLAHEISHVARRDALTQLLSLVHRAIFWFNPLSWWLDRQLTDLAEQASDEAALAGGADRTRYAETLLAFFAQLAASRRRVWWQGVAMAKHERKAGSAERRVNRILAWNGAMSMKKSFAVAIIALAAPLIFLAASVHPSFIAHAQEAPTPPAKPANVIAPGGPVAPALPNAPKGGVKGGVVAPAMPPGPSTPGPSGSILGSGPVALAPSAGVVAPAMPPAPTGPASFHPSGEKPSAPAASLSPSAPLASQVPFSSSPSTALVPSIASETPVASIAPLAPYSSYSPYSSIAPMAPLTPQAAIAAEDSARAQDVQAQLQVAQDALQKANQASKAAQAEQVRAALKAVAKAVAQAEQESDEVDSAQMLAAQHALEKANKIMEQGYASQIQEAREAMVEAKRDMQEAAAAQQEAARSITINGSYNMGSGGRYVIMTGSGESVEMSGDDEDVHHAQELRKKLGKDLIWFERDEKSYVITDPDFIAKAKALFAPEDALSKQQDELSRQQDALSKQQDALSEKMDGVKVKVPDITPDLQRINAELDALRKQDGGTQSELGRLQSELGQLQSQVGRFQSDAGVQQSAIGRQQGELGRQQGELGRKQGELGRQQGEIARQASRQLRQMLDDAIAKGIAKPE